LRVAFTFTLVRDNDIISGRRGIERRKRYLTTYSSWNYALIGAFVASCFSLVFYFMSSSARTAAMRERRSRLARGLFAVEFILLLAASAALFSAFLKHDFRLAYVASYSSRGLSAFYLVSGFWAGQEGTFLLWAAISGAIGLILAASASHTAAGARIPANTGASSYSSSAVPDAVVSAGAEASVMRFYVLVHVVLMVLLLRATPFRLLPAVPADGAGLNPLLQDPWMVIHPPIVFIGYALYAVPFAYAISALARDEYSEWAKPALAWTVAAWLFLGAGIIIGAKWAYATLGWGGYWGWDPVENASLVPWLAGAALMHTLIVQRERGKMVRTNIVLAIVSFLLIVYATFLTRSGVLSNFSVHSFASLGLSSYLVAACVLFATLSLWMLVWRWRSMTSKRNYREPYDQTVSRDFAFFLTALLFVASAAIVSLGTSTPLLTSFSGNPSSVGQAFYNMTNAPLGFMLMLTVAVCPHLAYGASTLAQVGKAMLIPAVAAIVLTVVAVLLGATGVWFVLFLFAAFMALAGNLVVLVKRIRARMSLRVMGGLVAHLGIALILIGVIATSAYNRTETISLQAGEELTVFGWRVAYVSRDEFEAAGSHRPSVAWNLEVSKPGSGTAITAKPYMRPTNQGMLRHPAIVSTIASDLYISPLQEDASREPSWADNAKEVRLHKGEQVEVDGLAVKFVGFDMSQHLGENVMAVGATLEVLDISSSRELGTVTPVLGFAAGGQMQTDALIDLDAADSANPGDAAGTRSVAFRLTSIDAGAGMAVLRIGKLLPGDDVQGNQSGQQSVTLEISMKPFASLLWVGSVLLLAGTAVAVVRRAKEASAR
jgi:cytochrome c-type biogenesis protein CcmF